MNWPESLRGIVAEKLPLGARTVFRTGGPADWTVRPRSVDELVAVVKSCRSQGVPFRVFGAGSNILVPDDGYHGVVIELDHADFCSLSIDKPKVAAGAGMALAEVISKTCEVGLSGLEVLVGIPGSLGGAVFKNAGGRSGDIGQFVTSVDIVDRDGTVGSRSRPEIRFGYRSSDLDDAIVTRIHLRLFEENPQDLVRRIKKIWIEKKARQPFEFQHAGYVFRDPRGLSAAELIDKASLRGTKVGGAELSDRDPRYIVAGSGSSSRDIRQLIDLVVARVEEQTGLRLELQIDLW